MTRRFGGATQPWSGEEEDALRTAASEGRTATEIAQTLAQYGFPLRSRSSIIGKCDREGVQLRSGALGRSTKAARNRPWTRLAKDEADARDLEICRRLDLANAAPADIAVAMGVPVDHVLDMRAALTGG